MKEVGHDKGLYTDAEFDQAISNGEARQAGEEVADNTAPLISDEDARQITVITLMRIYDVLGAILNHLDEQQAEALLDKHAEGKLQGPLPSLNL